MYGRTADGLTSHGLLLQQNEQLVLLLRVRGVAGVPERRNGKETRED